MFARPFIDSINFAKKHQELCGEIPVAALPRLGDKLASSGGMLSYSVYGLKEGDRCLLDVALNGECVLLCQRCLSKMPYPIKSSSRLLLLPADRLDEVDDDENVDGIEAATQLDVLALIEDEVLLTLPFAPKHPDGACSTEINAFQQAENPFSVLAELKLR